MPENKDVTVIRRAEAADLPRLAEAEQVCFGQEAWDAEGLEWLFNDLEVCFWLLEDEAGKLRSWVVWGKGTRSFQAADIPAFSGDLGNHRFIRVMSIATLPEFRGSGFARSLLVEGLEKAQAEGYSGAVLEVRPRNFPARRLYESLGFYRVAVLPGWFQSPEEDGEIWVKQF
ncbi:MAG: N-acetyltransferase [Mobiluncus porci]|uniref:GNAT family N-acetyltransferase n=1 Tax=Mobiluncus porci TaxID=2652278 RepID=UPI0023EFE13C|nr:N-acetyltransferase [Mobiluncus porci]MDD7541260.1 N-acetyltransferase [Mobiluncus porci]